MKYFKKFFTMIHNGYNKMYDSKYFVIATFIHDTVNSMVSWVKETSSFIDQMKMVIASIAIINTHIMTAVRSIGKKKFSAN